MSVKYNGYNSHYLTMENDDVKQGDLVKVNSTGKVCKANANDAFIGVCASVRGDLALIQTHGYVQMKFVTTVNYGIHKLCTGGGNTVCETNDNGPFRTAIVVEVDNDNKTVGIILC